MTWLDNAIGWLAPQAGMRRIAYRAAMDQHQRAYEAARRDHRTASWHTAGSSANAEIGSAEEIVRNRSRDLVRNNGYAQQIVETLADHIVGTGIVSAPTGLKGRNLKRVQQLYRDFVDYCDFEGDQDLNGLMWGAIKGMSESGSALIRFRRQQFGANPTTVPLRLQLLEPDFIDLMKTGTVAGGGVIDRGIEYDAAGRRVAFWLYGAHPGDVASWRLRSMESTRVPAEEIAYLFDKLRPGQDRGMPVLAPAVMTLQDLRSYFQAELVRKRIGACMVGVITTTDEAGAMIGTKPAQKPTYGPQTQKMEPGMFTRLLPSEDIKFNTPPADGSIDQMATQYLRETAAAGGVMYEHATGDFSHVNYSSWRAGHHGFRRRMERKQWGIAVHKGCAPITARFTEAANAAAMLPALPGWRHTPPGFISVDPYKDAQADLANLRMGKVTPSQLVEERGYDYAEFLAQVADDLLAADKALPGGARFDGDPRKVLNSGTPAKGDPADDKSDAATAA